MSTPELNMKKLKEIIEEIHKNLLTIKSNPKEIG